MAEVESSSLEQPLPSPPPPHAEEPMAGAEAVNLSATSFHYEIAAVTAAATAVVSSTNTSLDALTTTQEAAPEQPQPQASPGRARARGNLAAPGVTTLAPDTSTHEADYSVRPDEAERFYRETVVREMLRQERLASRRDELYGQPRRVISPLKSAEFYERQRTWEEKRLQKIEEERMLRNDLADIRTTSAARLVSSRSASPVARLADQSLMSQQDFEEQCRQLADPEAFERERLQKQTAQEMFHARQRQFLETRERRLREERDKAEQRFVSPSQPRQVAVPDFIDHGFLETDLLQRSEAFLVKRDARIEQLRKEVYHELGKAKKRLTEEEYSEMYRRSVNWLRKREENYAQLRKEQEQQEREARQRERSPAVHRRPSSASSQRDDGSGSPATRTTGSVISESVSERNKAASDRFYDRLSDARQKAAELPPKEIRAIPDFGPPPAKLQTPHSGGDTLSITPRSAGHSAPTDSNHNVTPSAAATVTPGSTSAAATVAASGVVSGTASSMERRASVGSISEFVERVKGKYAGRLNESSASVGSWMPQTTKPEPFRLETEERARVRATPPKARPAASPAKSYIEKIVTNLDVTQSPFKQHALVNFLERMSKTHDVRHAREVEEEHRYRGDGWKREGTVPSPFRFSTDERASVRQASPARARTPSSAEATISQLVSQLSARKSRPTTAGTPGSRQASQSPRRSTPQTPFYAGSRGPSPSRATPDRSTPVYRAPDPSPSPSALGRSASSSSQPEDVRRAVERLRKMGASLRPQSPGE